MISMNSYKFSSNKMHYYMLILVARCRNDKIKRKTFENYETIGTGSVTYHKLTVIKCSTYTPLQIIDY